MSLQAAADLPEIRQGVPRGDLHEAAVEWPGHGDLADGTHDRADGEADVHLAEDPLPLSFFNDLADHRRIAPFDANEQFGDGFVLDHRYLPVQDGMQAVLVDHLIYIVVDDAGDLLPGIQVMIMDQAFQNHAGLGGSVRNEAFEQLLL